MLCVVSATFRPLYPRKDPALAVQETGCAPGPGWTGVENFTPTAIRSLKLPLRSESIYGLICPAETRHNYIQQSLPLVHCEDDH
jgi:hypothetical protein